MTPRRDRDTRKGRKPRKNDLNAQKEKVHTDMENTTIRISSAASRTSPKWRNAETTWEDLLTRCSTPKDTGETPAQWAAMTRDERGRVKDVGGFVGGWLRDGIRRRGMCILRSLITLDIDRPDQSPDDLWGWLSGTALEGTAMLMYSTHSHTPDSPRLRLVIPLSRAVTRDVYEPLARKVAAEAGIDCFDPTTFDPERLFYWPSHSTGAEFVFRHADGDPLDPDRWLALYSDPSDPMEWPRAEGEAPAEVVRQAAGAARAENPTSKRGLVGAFCRAYPVHLAIDTFLPHIYAPTDRKDRYTYRLGESTGGLVIYDGLWAWSFHATDPARGRLLNAFDLVRVHRFGDLDRGAADTSDPSSLPSHRAMCALCADRREVMREAGRDTSDVEGATDEGGTPARKAPDGWTALLTYTKKGALAQTIQNAVTVLENDPALRGRIYHNLLTGRTETTGGLPWRNTGGQWRDDDDANLRLWMEREHGISGKDRLFDAVVAVSTAHPRHPIREWLDSLRWDGVKRVERLLIDRLGAADNPATREMTRNQLAAAIMRVYEPGSKHDHMLVMAGPEGIGKSTLLRILGGEWYTDSVTTAEGKESMDQLQGVWIVEHSELASTKRAEVETLKAYITRQNDRYRAPYGRRVMDHPRQCVFFGTTNEANFLKGDTGNRRFWVVPVDGFGDGARLDGLEVERGQIWAEAKALYDGGLRGAALELGPEAEMEARKRQKEYNDYADDPLWGQIDDFLDMPLPYEWDVWDERRRYIYVHDPNERNERNDKRCSGKRGVVCAMEVMHEALGIRQNDPYTARKINAYIESLPNWKKMEHPSRHAEKLYGRQRSFRRDLNVEKVTNEKYNEDDDL